MVARAKPDNANKFYHNFLKQCITASPESQLSKVLAKTAPGSLILEEARAARRGNLTFSKFATPPNTSIQVPYAKYIHYLNNQDIEFDAFCRATLNHCKAGGRHNTYDALGVLHKLGVLLSQNTTLKFEQYLEALKVYDQVILRFQDGTIRNHRFMALFGHKLFGYIMNRLLATNNSTYAQLLPKLSPWYQSGKLQVLLDSNDKIYA